MSSVLIKDNWVAWLQPVELRRGQGGGSGASMSAWCQLPHLILEWLAKEPESVRLCRGKDSLALCQQNKTKDIQETQGLGEETSHTHPRAGSTQASSQRGRSLGSHPRGLGRGTGKN